MDVTSFVQNTYLLAAGKATTPSTTNYNKILALGNMFSSSWQNEPGIDWNSLRGDFDAGTTSASNSVELPDGMSKISSQEGDYVTLTRTDGKIAHYTIVPITKLFSMQRGNADGLCAKSGANLVFDKTFAETDADFGASVSIPGYAAVDTLVNPGDAIQVDDPYWLCYISAAEYVRNDVTKQNQYGNLIADAINSMDGMKERNASQREEVDTSNWSPLGQTW